MKLIVGLGNPGIRYRFSRHNMGFLVLDALAKEQDIETRRKNFDSCFGKGMISGVTAVLAKPQTFMNLSGITVKKLVGYFKTDIEDLIVIHDDLDLPLGSLRIKAGGGHGGHKGLISIIDHLGGSEFIRIRLGIGKPGYREMVEGYVLERFTEDEMKILPDIITRACDAVVEVISSGTQSAMCQFNVRNNNKLNKEV
ncbi:MAG: aminoacyl-tRNA hydrolase [Proteobacteria bacterium]|nr:aminoacyl-tRNA hydrolase [Pseudomonadota bacterium]